MRYDLVTLLQQQGQDTTCPILRKTKEITVFTEDADSFDSEVRWILIQEASDLTCKILQYSVLRMR